MRNKLILAALLVVMTAAGAVILTLGPGKPDSGETGLLFPFPVNGTGSKVTKRILPESQFNEKESLGGSRVFSADDVLWQGKEVAFDQKLQTIYLPCSPEAELTWQQILSGLTPSDSSDSLWFSEDSMSEDTAAAMREGHAFRALLSGEEGAVGFSVVLTGLPVLSLRKTDSAELSRKENHRGEISVIPLLGVTAQAGAQNIKCDFHIRGNVTSTLRKKPFKLSLLDERGNKLKAGLLDLRSDDDWVLNPVYTDSTRVRESTAYALWDRVQALSENPVPTSRTRYIEVFLDQEYLGIYCLTERIDKKQLSLSEGDLLYKISRWDWEYPYVDLYEEAENEKATGIYNDSGFVCVEIKYPTGWDSTATWEPMRVYHEFCFKNRDVSTLTSAGLQTDLTNLTDFSLFCAMTHSMDTNWKNSFLIARRQPDGGYKLTRTIWDLNYVFGDVFLYDPKAGYTEFDPATAERYEPGEDSSDDFEAFLAADPSMWDKLRERWRMWREREIDADLICELAESNLEILRASGAMGREMEKWPQDITPEDSLKRMEDWIRRRFDYLDLKLEIDT